MKFVTVPFFSRRPHRLCLFVFAGLWILFLVGNSVHADPLQLQATFVEEGLIPCAAFSVQGVNFSFNSQIQGGCSGNNLIAPGDILESQVGLSSPSGPPFQTYATGEIDVPQNPNRVAILTGGIGAVGSRVTIPLDRIGIFQLETPVTVIGTLSACLLPAGHTFNPPCDPNYVDFADINVSVTGFDVFTLDCFNSLVCSYDEDFTGTALPEPGSAALIGLAGFGALLVYRQRRNVFKRTHKP